MSLTNGTKLGPYEILMLLGAGGTGEVCRARDTRLDRTVAIKTSKAEFSEHFAREARERCGVSSFKTGTAATVHNRIGYGDNASVCNGVGRHSHAGLTSNPWTGIPGTS